MVESTPNTLENSIERLRKELILHAANKGLHCEQTILVSQRLDAYIAEYQSIKKNCSNIFS